MSHRGEYRKMGRGRDSQSPAPSVKQPLASITHAPAGVDDVTTNVVGGAVVGADVGGAMVGAQPSVPEAVTESAMVYLVGGQGVV